MQVGSGMTCSLRRPGRLSQATLQLPERGELKAKWMPIMGRVQRTRRAAPMEILEGDEPREDMNT